MTHTNYTHAHAIKRAHEALASASRPEAHVPEAGRMLRANDRLALANLASDVAQDAIHAMHEGTGDDSREYVRQALRDLAENARVLALVADRLRDAI